MAWLNRLVNLVRSERLSKDIDRELAFHIEERVEELVEAGMNAADARREAKRRFGDPLRQRERTRDVDVLVWLDTVCADVRYALRALRRSPAFSLVAILSLALGIGANTAIFSLIDAVLLKSLPVERPEELVRLIRGEQSVTVTNPIWEELRDRQDFFSGVFAYGETEFNLAQGGEAHSVLGNWVSGDFFATLGVQPALGRLIRREDAVRGCAAVAVLSHSLWRREHGADPGVIGRSISLNGVAHSVLGVADARFTGVNVGQPTQVFAPLCSREVHQKGVLDLRSHWYLQVMGRPASGVTLQQVQARIAAMAPAIHAATVPTDWGAEQQRNYQSVSLGAEPAPNGNSLVRKQYTQPLVALMVVVGVVLLIACVNVANLLLARAAVRRRELAIRLAIGAGRLRLLRQMLTESLLLAGLGAVVGFAFAQWSSRLLVALLSSRSGAVWLDLSISGRMLGFTTLVATLTGILFGLAPAWSSTRLAPQGAMKETGRGIAEGHSRFNVGKVLVAAQVALSLVLLVSAGLLLGSFRSLSTLDAGFDREGVLLVSINLPSDVPPEQRFTVQRQLLERFRALPGARSASSSDMTPISGSTWNNFVAVDGYSPGSSDDAMVYFNEVSDGYFATLRTTLIAGRDFDSSDVPGTQRVALINLTMARRFFGDANPVGREFRVQVNSDQYEPPTRIIGVVEDAKYESLRETTLPTAYLSNNQTAQPTASETYQLLSAGAPEALIEAVKDVVTEVNPNISLEFGTLEAQVASSLTRERMLALLSAFFGALALLLSVIGLYGTLSYSVARRRKEIGVRLALGAAPARVLRMVLGEAGTMVLAGLVIGVIAALAGARLISSFLFGLSPTDPKTIVLAAVLLSLVALVASAIPAWRAAHTDSLMPLREE
jgi:predicted permease